jgi:hypothetical protein
MILKEKVQDSKNLNLTHEIRTQIEVSKINKRVIFLNDSKNNKGCVNSNYEREEGRKYWFHKYLQDLQNRGLSQKIVK